MDYSLMYHPHGQPTPAAASSSTALALNRRQPSIQPVSQDQLSSTPPFDSAAQIHPPLTQQFTQSINGPTLAQRPKRSYTSPLQSLETRLSAFLWACDEGTHGGALDRSTSTGECYWSGNAGMRGQAGAVAAGVGMERSGSGDCGEQSSPIAPSPYTSLSSSPSSTYHEHIHHASQPQFAAPPPPPLTHTSTSPASLPTSSIILEKMGMTTGKTWSQKDRARSFGSGAVGGEIHPYPRTGGGLKDHAPMAPQSGSGNGTGRTIKGFETIQETKEYQHPSSGPAAAAIAGVGMRRAASLDVGTSSAPSLDGARSGASRGRFNPSVDPRLLGI